MSDTPIKAKINSIVVEDSNHIIYKYKLDRQNVNKLRLPALTQVLDIQVQGGDLCMWCLVDKNQQLYEDRFFQIIPTGMHITKLKKVYLKTVQAPPFVWHIFEVF